MYFAQFAETERINKLVCSSILVRERRPETADFLENQCFPYLIRRRDKQEKTVFGVPLLQACIAHKPFESKEFRKIEGRRIGRDSRAGRFWNKRLSLITGHVEMRPTAKRIRELRDGPLRVSGEFFAGHRHGAIRRVIRAEAEAVVERERVLVAGRDDQGDPFDACLLKA